MKHFTRYYSATNPQRVDDESGTTDLSPFGLGVVYCYGNLSLIRDPDGCPRASALQYVDLSLDGRRPIDLDCDLRAVKASLKTDLAVGGPGAMPMNLFNYVSAITQRLCLEGHTIVETPYNHLSSMSLAMALQMGSPRIIVIPSDPRMWMGDDLTGQCTQAESFFCPEFDPHHDLILSPSIEHRARWAATKGRIPATTKEIMEALTGGPFERVMKTNR